MFGLAHLGMPLSIPMLILVGLGFGYLRVGSRSIILPMILHFAHNATVTLVEYYT
jgi:membrane protease YdiL (CAAX protease family)